MSENLFICEVCGKVMPDDCPNCPDRGNGKGVTVLTIKRHIEAAPDHPSIQATRKHYGRHIATLHKAGGAARTMAIQIENLVEYSCMMIRKDQERAKGA